METLNYLLGFPQVAVSPATYCPPVCHHPPQKIISSFSGALSQKTSTSCSFLGIALCFPVFLNYVAVVGLYGISYESLSLSQVASTVFPCFNLWWDSFSSPLCGFQTSPCYFGCFDKSKRFRGLRACVLLLHSVRQENWDEAIWISILDSTGWYSCPETCSAFLPSFP